MLLNMKNEVHLNNIDEGTKNTKHLYEIGKYHDSLMQSLS